MSSVKNEDNNLPDGWVLCQSKSIPGRNYYFNKKTGKSSWSQPQKDDKSDNKNCKKEKDKRLEKRKREEQSNKGTKRKSDSHEDNASKKRIKHDTAGSLANTSKRSSTSHNEQKRNESPNHTSSPKTTHSKSFNKNETPMKQSPVKNLANTRLSQLRALLNAEAKEEEDPDLPKKPKISPKCNESYKRNDNSPSFNDSKSTQSPSSDSLQSIPSPSQFFAANKIISSMKAQLPEEYCSKEKQKDTFADIEKGICSQTTEYPYSKHPATPPQFSEASKLMSAIKSKLAYKGSTSKEIQQFRSAKERMENLKMRLQTENEFNSSCSFLYKNEKICEVDTEDSKNTSEAMEVDDFREIKPKSLPIQRDNIGEGENLVLVVDSNIFIDNLHIIKHVLNSHIRGYSKQPTLLIPWRVINELDRLKDNNNGNGFLCKRAKAAIEYLYKSLPEHKRIKGQSLRDANSHIYPCEVPDDEILNCSLQQVERGKNVILVSNDKNLCTKATINGVKRIDVHELKKLIENKPQAVGICPDLLTNVKCYQQNMYRLLANILENEMRARYNNLWQHVLFKAPPWSLMDVIKCLLKHWIPVFSEVFPRIQSIIVDFKNSLLNLNDKDAKTLTPSEVTNFKELCLDIARKCQIIPDYMDLAKITVEKLLKNSGEELPSEQNHRRVNDESQARLNDENQARLNESQVGEEVVAAFEGMWTVLSSYCAKLSTGLGIEHTIDDKLPRSEHLTTLINKWDEYSRHVNDLICAIDGLLNTEDSSPHIQRLENVLKDVSNVVSTTQLTSFCLNCRNMLQEAHSKFSQLSELLNIRQVMQRESSVKTLRWLAELNAALLPERENENYSYHIVENPVFTLIDDYYFKLVNNGEQSDLTLGYFFF